MNAVTVACLEMLCRQGLNLTTGVPSRYVWFAGLDDMSVTDRRKTVSLSQYATTISCNVSAKDT